MIGRGRDCAAMLGAQQGLVRRNRSRRVAAGVFIRHRLMLHRHRHFERAQMSRQRELLEQQAEQCDEHDPAAVAATKAHVFEGGIAVTGRAVYVIAIKLAAMAIWIWLQTCSAAHDTDQWHRRTGRAAARVSVPTVS